MLKLCVPEDRGFPNSNSPVSFFDFDEVKKTTAERVAALSNLVQFKVFCSEVQA